MLCVVLQEKKPGHLEVALEKFLKNQRNLQNIHDKYHVVSSDDETVMMREVLAPAFKKLEGGAGAGQLRYLVRVEYMIYMYIYM